MNKSQFSDSQRNLFGANVSKIFSVRNLDGILLLFENKDFRVEFYFDEEYEQINKELERYFLATLQKFLFGN